ncbi:MAG: DUF3750 domain-containing protein [Rhodospirillaceae bacterium]
MVLSFVLFVLAPLAVVIGLSVASKFCVHKRSKALTPTEDRKVVGLAPDPKKDQRAIIQVYGAPSFGEQGVYSLHCWIAMKRQGDSGFSRREIVGWSAGPDVRENVAKPDARWYGQDPILLRDLRGGPDVEALIGRLEAAIESWPHAGRYQPYPGPNSNTLIAHLSRQVPELGLDLPANAMGKDYRSLAHILGRPPSGRGVQFCLFGLFGFILSPVEGLELNFGGFCIGVKLFPFALRLPCWGNLPQHCHRTELAVLQQPPLSLDVEPLPLRTVDQEPLPHPIPSRAAE